MTDRGYGCPNQVVLDTSWEAPGQRQVLTKGLNASMTRPHPQGVPQTPPLNVWPPTDFGPVMPGVMTPGLADRIVSEFCPSAGVTVELFTTSAAHVVGAAATRDCLGIAISADPALLAAARRELDRTLPADRRAMARFRPGDPCHLPQLLNDLTG